MLCVCKFTLLSELHYKSNLYQRPSDTWDGALWWWEQITTFGSPVMWPQIQHEYQTIWSFENAWCPTSTMGGRSIIFLYRTPVAAKLWAFTKHPIQQEPNLASAGAFFQATGSLNIFSSDADNIFLMNQKIILIVISTINIPHFFLLVDWWETRASQPSPEKITKFMLFIVTLSKIWSQTT